MSNDVASAAPQAGPLGRADGVTPTPPQAPISTSPIRPKQQRRPLLIVAMVVLVCLGGLISAYAYSSTSDTQDVVAVREPVARGEVIETDDLHVVQIGIDSALNPVPSDRLDEFIGQRAAFDLAAGGLLTNNSTSDEVLPAEGQSVVGVSLTAAMMPSEPIYAGDRVRLVTTPGDQGEIVDDVVPVTIEADVVGVSEIPDTGETVVDVAVDDDLAADLAARAATRKVALVLDSRER